MRPPKLKRSMGLWMATALVVGSMIGSGVFVLPASLADTAGSVSMLGWVFTGAGAILLALGLRQPRPRCRARAGRTPTRSGRSVISSASRRLGILDRGVGRQRGHRSLVRGLPRGVLAPGLAVAPGVVVAYERNVNTNRPSRRTGSLSSGRTRSRRC